MVHMFCLLRPHWYDPLSRQTLLNPEDNMFVSDFLLINEEGLNGAHWFFSPTPIPLLLYWVTFKTLFTNSIPLSSSSSSLYKTQMAPFSSSLLITLSLFLLQFHRLLAIQQPDPVSIQSFLPTQTPSTITIPAFPEQSDLSGCPLDLPDDLFHGIENACGGNTRSGHLRHSQCCPVLAAWLYSAYASTALGRASSRMSAASPYDLPVLPDDSETCVDTLEKSLKGKGIELIQPNQTCDLVSCYCGIRLHPLSCPEAFSVSKEGKLVGDESVDKLEKNCLLKHRYSTASGCSKCLKSLYQLRELKEILNNKSMSDRRSKMHNRDCELMGLTWLLSKNRTAYIPTVSAVLRALMMNPDGSDPRSCSLASDGMPLAVDSAELDGQSSSSNNIILSTLHLAIALSVSLLYVSSMVLNQF